MDRQEPQISTETENVLRVVTSPFTGRYLLIILGVCIVVAIIVAIAIW